MVEEDPSICEARREAKTIKQILTEYCEYMEKLKKCKKNLTP